MDPAEPSAGLQVEDEHDLEQHAIMVDHELAVCSRVVHLFPLLFQPRRAIKGTRFLQNQNTTGYLPYEQILCQDDPDCKTMAKTTIFLGIVFSNLLVGLALFAMGSGHAARIVAFVPTTGEPTLFVRCCSS